jgi:zinc protease
VALLPKKNRGETVSVSLRLHWGDEKNQFGKAMVAAAVGQMLNRGTTKYTRAQLADAWDKLKMTGSAYQFDTTRANLEQALRLAAHVLKEPTFDPAEFEQLRQQWLVQLEASRSEPQHYAHYPKGDVRTPLTIDEQIAQIKAMTVEDLKAYHREFYGASHGELAIVGDFDKAAAQAVVAQELGGWQSRAPYARIIDSNVPHPPLDQFVNTPDKENGFYTARIDIDLNSEDDDYPALELANYILGDGGLKSRIMDRIRQKDGLSYGGGSALAVSDIDRASHLSVSAIAAPQNLNKLKAAIREELARALKDGFTKAEIDGARSGILQQRLQNRSQDGVLAAGWTSFLYLNRTYAWSKAFEDKLKALTPAQVNAAFRKAVDLNKLNVVVAGDAAKAR